MLVMIDCYGHPASSERFQRGDFRKKPYLVDKASESVTYVCFDGTAKRAIHRISVFGTVTEIKWAFGAWTNRASLNYSATLNDPVSVDEADLG